MKMWLDLLLLVIGFVLLLKGADAFVDGSAGVARIFKVPGVIIGLTIVAMGTSAPELAVYQREFPVPMRLQSAMWLDRIFLIF